MCELHEGLIEVVKNLEEINAELQGHVEELERDMRARRARETRLINQLERERGQEAQGKIVEEIITHWKMATGHLKAKVSQTGERAAYVRKALHFGYTIEELKKVCDTAGQWPYVDPKRSGHPSGRCRTGEILRDDIPTIFKSELTIDRLLDLGEKPIAPGANDSLSTAEAWRRLHYPLARVMAALWDLNAPIESPSPDEWRTNCPVHFGPGLIARRNDAGLMLVECERGCALWRILAALGLEPSDLFENSEQDPARKADGPRETPAHLTEAAGVLMARLSGLAA